MRNDNGVRSVGDGRPDFAFGKAARDEAAPTGRKEGEYGMNVYDALMELKKIARKDPEIRKALLETRLSPHPVDEFCRLSTEYGYPLLAMDLITAGEEDYAAMKRSTNGGGENSPMLEGEDDYYEITTTPDDFRTVRDAMEVKYTLMSAEISMIPQTMVTLTDEKQITMMSRMLESMEDNDDVQNVYHNWDMPDDLE